MTRTEHEQMKALLVTNKRTREACVLHSTNSSEDGEEACSSEKAGEEVYEPLKVCA